MFDVWRQRNFPQFFEADPQCDSPPVKTQYPPAEGSAFLDNRRQFFFSAEVNSLTGFNFTARPHKNFPAFSGYRLQQQNFCFSPAGKSLAPQPRRHNPGVVENQQVIPVQPPGQSTEFLMVKTIFLPRNDQKP